MANRDAGDISSTHPYYPLGILIPHYAANETPLPQVLVPFVAVLLLPIPIAFVTSRLIKPSLGGLDRFAVCWFALGAFLHCCFEGYFVWNHATLAGLQSLFAQAWKEYALSDSRYLTSDPFMVCVEALTVIIWGPISLSVTFAILSGSRLRHPLQLVICVGHLYGVALYYSTSLAERALVGTMHSRPEVLYFWVYYVGFNAPWVVVPLILLVQSLRATSRAFQALEEKETAEAALASRRKGDAAVSEGKKTR
ncbi:EBDP2 [Verticillium alfalfae VaMs.102]|uniref:EBDP2 n=1 Tax=Verticillium alfalfae (strain VaMs.102 / ATCC MYA-4576 / FGSC 10136) TaxID=526221 RepID=C9SPH8_VERA1|nr:EBDP2 [Verticillium alfalfae VaMs.102]EEY20693.1 EBDP2 [Verticillium alfalfae VaMs.102]